MYLNQYSVQRKPLVGKLYSTKLNNSITKFYWKKIHHYKKKLVVKAQEQKEQEKTLADQEEEEKKALARIEALESRGKKKSAQLDQQQLQSQNLKDDLPKQERAEWKEGKLFPEGWEDMNLGQKAYELYIGERGLLFWMTKIAYYLLFVLVGGWILFRFVGPALNLYELQSGFEVQL
eukprot:TRINITY_DN630_c0_g1_i1.p3 TRINITY_DN630_c0_g1~~TRINITY_DN630_c0_g1_i1.p3  ORF type:complete len:177 (-),score=29.79 TRINITY_DN630_c0_g1_i1:462-992(-)